MGALYDLLTERPERDDERTRVAVAVLEVVAAFTDAHDQAADLLTGHDDVEAGVSVAVAAEALIRELGDEAEATTRHGAVVSAALDGHYLLDDYLRIRAVEQHDAFGHDDTDPEIRAREIRAQQVADAAAEAREMAATRAVYDRRLCRCGWPRGTHHRTADSGAALGERPCWRFRDLEDAALSEVRAELLADGWAARVVAAGGRVDDPRLGEGTQVLAQLRRTAGTTLTVGEAYDAAAAATARHTPVS